jgi:hypothetical protein
MFIFWLHNQRVFVGCSQLEEVRLFDGLAWAGFDALAAKYAFVEVDLGALSAFYFDDGYCFSGAVSFADAAVGATHGFYVESEVFAAFKVDFVAGFDFID